MGNQLATAWEQQRTALNCWLSMPSSVSAELAAQQDFDSITVDLQHGLVDYATALPMLQALYRANATVMARVPWLDAGIIMKMLDAGALGIICPMINTAQEAQTFVSYCRYAPAGQRSFGPTRALGVYGSDYPQRANSLVTALAMIETRTGLENVEAIVATTGLDGVYIGPSDLALSLGYEPKLDHDEPAVVDAIKSILAAAHSAGLKAGIHCASTAYARDMAALGFDLVTLGSDIRLLSAAMTTAIGEMRVD